MADLLNYQWELDGLVFGMDCPVDHEADSDPGSYSWRTNDTPSPMGDGSRTGIDLIDPQTWNFKLFTNADSEEGAMAALSAIAKVWRGDGVRKTAGEVLPLRYKLAGRTRRVYGRPGRFAAPLGPSFHSGAILITSDFRCVSELYFDDTEESIEFGSDLPTTGGFTAPFTTPLTTTLQAADRPNSFSVGGDLATPGIFEFTGPRTDAYIDIDGTFQIQLNGEIPFGTTVIVDTRPWKMSITRQDGAGMGNLLSRRTRLPSIPRLTPGVHTATLGGTDPTGLSRGRVKWRKAYPSV